ncbi:SCO3242 family prenyltransferase [Streptomyces nodosus]|uniref:SCO3242 family prenyltransferase n=1 Tax=Streptomyces nodosus TaxID=40318 RepID=UPI003453B02B
MSHDEPGAGPSGTAVTPPSTLRPRGDGRRGTLRAWAELLRVPALFTVPGDALAGAAAVSARPTPRTLLAIGSSLCLYEAGMALNDWADRDEDARERPHRPLPSGRVHPTAALAAACALTAAGLTLAARAGRPALGVAVPLAATVWAYDLTLKHTPAGPAAMAAARGLDLLLGAAAGAGRVRPALRPAALLSTHTLAVTAVSRHETRGGAPLTALAALATTGALTTMLTRRRTPGAGRLGPGAGRGRRLPPGRGDTAGPEPSDGGARPSGGGLPRTARTVGDAGGGPPRAGRTAGEALSGLLAVAYATTAARPCAHAVLNPSPPLTQRAVGGGIRAMIPLQAALTARSGAPVSALFTVALAPIAAKFARKVSVT